MTSDERPSERGDGHTDSYIIPADALNRLRVALTVAHAHVQLLQRRHLHGDQMHREDYARTLSQMEEATQSMRAELRSFELVATRTLIPDDRA